MNSWAVWIVSNQQTRIPSTNISGIFSELSNQIKFAAQKRILLEVAIIKLCRPQMERDYSSLLERMDELEKKMENGVVTVPAASASVPETRTIIAKIYDGDQLCGTAQLVLPMYGLGQNIPLNGICIDCCKPGKSYTAKFTAKNLWAMEK